MRSPTEVNMLCGGAIIDWDFTASDSYKTLVSDGQKQLEPGTWAMFAANGEQVIGIGGVSSQDLNRWRMLQNVLGYSLGDYNMDVTTVPGDETIWKNNQNRFSAVFFY